MSSSTVSVMSPVVATTWPMLSAWLPVLVMVISCAADAVNAAPCAASVVLMVKASLGCDAKRVIDLAVEHDSRRTSQRRVLNRNDGIAVHRRGREMEVALVLDADGDVLAYLAAGVFCLDLMQD